MEEQGKASLKWTPEVFSKKALDAGLAVTPKGSSLLQTCFD
jgi:hypothetical protein